MTAMTRIKPRGIDTTGDYVVNSISSTGNVSAGNVKTDHLKYANGTSYTIASFTNDSGYLISSDLSTVATTGNYEDLNNKPTLFDGEYASLANKPTLFSGSYTDLSDKPSLFSGSYVDLTNKPSLFDGEYSSLANKPSLFSGSYVDLTNKPTLSTVAGTGNYADLNNKPTLFSGSYTDLTNKPSIPAKVSDLTNDTGFITTASLSGYATTTDVSNAVANLVNSAPSALDTLKELADAIGDDASYATSVTNALANKLSTSAFTSTADTWLATKSTSNVSEGTNLYYTVARANTAIDNRVTKTFVENLGANANVANTANSVAGANVTGQVGNALVAGTVYTNAQPNITSVGTLSSLSVTGTVSLGDIANLYIPGGTSGYVIKTNGSGTLSWTPMTIAGNANINGSNTQVFFNDAGSNTLGASANLTFNKSTNTLTTTNLVVTGTTNLGAVGNLTVTGGSSNTYLKTDGSGTLSWASLPSTTVALDSFTGNGVRTSYTLSSTPTDANYTIVAVAGVMQPKTTYSVSGNTLTFSEAPPNLAPVEITTINSGVSVPSGGGGGSAGYTYQGVSANTSLAVANRYIVNSSSSNITLTLPSSANLGDEIGIIDGTGTASSHAITVYPNGGNIMGATGNLVITTNRAAFILVYYNSSQGWLLTQI